ncbi:MAG: hypothetical protein ACSI46_22560 [Gloeotrichia echinulata DVL01]|nr:hypothetical protein [Gloeotrichia echinulata DEX184]
MEDSESAKQETTNWLPGSAQAQFGVKGIDNKFLSIPLTHHSRWGCQS